ncbi:sensor histidine kinase, partial [Chloroflexota bacterium]
MNYHRNQVWGNWQSRIRAVPLAYRLLAFGIAASQMLLFSTVQYSIIPPLILIASVGIYTLFKALHPFRWYQNRNIRTFLIGTDILVCIFLVTSTGGLYSPFLLYTLAPVLKMALFFDGRKTSAVAVSSGVYVIISHLFNPFFPTQLALPELSYFLIYVIAVCLAAVLPYMINANLRQRMETEDIIQERRRLSREIHDGTAQTLGILCWRVQLFGRRLMQMGIEMDEVKELGKLAEKARQDTRESLELLRNYTDDRSFLIYLQDHLERLNQDTNILFRLDNETREINLEAPVELELMRTCQEAMTNIKKHSGARNVRVKLRRINGHLEVSIVDDGCGFDAHAYYDDASQDR